MITIEQKLLLMQQPEFRLRVMSAGISVAGTVASEVVDGINMTLPRHEKRFALALQVLRSPISSAETYAPAIARRLKDNLEWPVDQPTNAEGASLLAKSIPDDVYKSAISEFWDFIAGWDVTGEAYKVVNP